MKRFRFLKPITLIILVAFLFLLANAQTDISLWIDKVKMTAEYQPVIEDGRSLAPIRVISQYLGAEVSWDGLKKQVIIDYGQDEIVLTIDQVEVKKNNQAYELDVPPRIIDGRTYVPLRFVSEVMGSEVAWDAVERRIDITTRQKILTGLSLTTVNEREALLIATEGNYTYETFSLPNPSRFIIDLHDVLYQSVNQSLAVNKASVLQVRASQFSFEPLVARVVLDLEEEEAQVEVEYIEDLGLVIYLESAADPLPEENPDVTIPDYEDDLTDERASLWIAVDADDPLVYETTAIYNQEKEKIYGTISSARVNLRSEPSTASPDTVLVTVDGGSVYEVLGQTEGWYQVKYKDSTAWVADWLLTLDLTMKRTNVNVRKGPGSQYAVVDTVLAGENIKVTERHLDWVKVITPEGVEGYIADWLVGINERLVEDDTVYEQVAQSLQLSIEDVTPAQINIGEWPEVVQNIELMRQGTGTLINVELTEPLGYEIIDSAEGLQVSFGAILTDIEVTSSLGRMMIDLWFNSPTKYVVYQNLVDNMLILDFAYSQAQQEYQYNPDNDLVSSLEIANRVDSMQMSLSLNHIGSYKINTIGYSDHIQLELLDSSMQGKVIAIDPGHGGSDPGTIAYGVNEADVNLAVALKVRDLLAQKGVAVVMTRDTDKHVSLEERVNYVNSMEADLMVSIHVNSSSGSIGSGVEVFYYPNQENERLARLLQDAVVAATGFRSRGIKPYGWYVIKNSTMPSALVELGFLNNKSELEVLVDDMAQQEIAESIIQAIEKFFIE